MRLLIAGDRPGLFQYRETRESDERWSLSLAGLAVLEWEVECYRVGERERLTLKDVALHDCELVAAHSKAYSSERGNVTDCNG